MEIKPKDFKIFFPMPITLITTVDKENRINAAPYACVMPILRPLNLVAIASAKPRDTLRNIRQMQEFVINMVGKSILKEAMRCARSYPEGINELLQVGLSWGSSKIVKPPRVLDALGWIEAKLERIVEDGKWTIVVGEVVSCEINDSFIKEEKLFESPLLLFYGEIRKLGETFAKRDEFLEDISTIKF